MKNPDPSLISRSQSSASSQVQKAEENTRIMSRVSFYPLIDHVSQGINLPSFIYYILLIFNAIQVLFVSLWSPHSNYWPNGKISSNFIKYIYSLACFCSPEDPTDYSIMISFIIFSVIFVLTVVCISSQIICYRKRRRFFKITLFPTRFLLEFFPSILVIPLGVLCGNLFVKVCQKNVGIDIILFFALTTIEFIIMAVLFYVVNSLIGISPYLSISPFCSFTLQPFINIVLTSSIFGLISFTSLNFPAWIQHPFVVMHFLILLYVLTLFIKRPFVFEWMNGFWIAINISCLINDVVKLVYLFMKGNPNGLFGFIFFFLSIAAGIACSIVQINIQNKKLKKASTFEGIPDERERIERLSEIGADTNDNVGQLFIDYCWNHNVRALLVDGFFFRFMAQYHHSIEFTVHLMKLACFLPPNSRVLNVLSMNAMKMRSLHFSYRFFFYQVQNIRMLRQSSSSSTAVEKMKEMKQASRDLEGKMRSFFERNEANITMFYNLSNQTSKIAALWEESLTNFPNSIPYAEEYSHFLIECSTDFSNAILQKHRAEMIETGRNFTVDICFKQFIRNFPTFLKKKIIDMKGNFIVDEKKEGSTLSNVNLSSGSSSASLDIQLEETLGRSLITRARVRLALQHATANRHANFSMPFMLTCIVHFFVCFACFLFLFIFFSDYFKERGSTIERIEFNTMTRMNLFTSTFALLNYWGTSEGTIDTSKWDQMYSRVDEGIDAYFPTEMSWANKTMYFNVIARGTYASMVSDVTTLAELGVNVRAALPQIFEDTSTLTYCDQGKPMDPELTDMKSLLIYLLISQSMTLTYPLNDWYKNVDQYCTLVSTLQTCWKSFQEVEEGLTSSAKAEADLADKEIVIMMIAFPICASVVCITSFILFAYFYQREINLFSQILFKLPKDAKEEASMPLRKDVDDADFVLEQSSTALPMFDLPLAYSFGICIFYLLIAVLMLFQLFSLRETNRFFYNLSHWTKDARIRKTLIIEIDYWLSQSILSLHQLQSTNQFVNLSNFMILANTNFVKLDDAAKSLMEDTDDSPGVVGVDPVIDEISMKETCLSNTSDPSYHEMYRCASAQQTINYYLSVAKQIMIDISVFNGTIQDEISSSVSHIASFHLMPKMIMIDNRFTTVLNNKNDSHHREQQFFFAFEVIGSLLALLLCFFFKQALDKAYDVTLALLRRVSPIAIVGDTELMNYLLDKSKEASGPEMSTHQGIIFSSNCSVLCLSSSGVIEILNPVVSKTFGYTPEQLLGQPLSTIICDDLKPQIEQQLQLMANRQSSLTFEDHTSCLTDDNTMIPCAITIYAMTDGNSGSVSSFVVILRDEGVLLKQQEEAEKAKEQSESLLYHILPRDIVIRLNQGEKDISFTVPSSTICFIDIVKFSDYAASLTPQEIMGNLSLLFAGFDEAVTKHDLLLKIKLIGDVYMCAGGLFNPDEPPVSHAEQMIKFGLEALQILDDTNVKLSAVLNVRIGVNTGGPLIAGVLGTDKPTFDIIGDPINIASRLQSTDIPGKIQISQATYNLVNEMDFQFESRGEIFLKGKGKQPAYLVSSTRYFSLQSSTDGLPSSVSTIDKLTESSQGI